MTFSGLHEIVRRTPNSSEQDECRRSRCAEGGSVEDAIADDLELTQRLLRCESSAWQEFLQRYERLIYSRVLATWHELGSQPQVDIIEDCCGEVMSQLFANDLAALRRYQGRSRLSTWLSVVTRRIALRFLLKSLRTAQRTQQPDSQFDLQTFPAPESKVTEDKEEEKLLKDCLQELSDSDRQTLLLHSQKIMSYEEIGRELGIAANSVGAKLDRARKRLKKLVERKRREETSRSTSPRDPDPNGMK